MCGIVGVFQPGGRTEADDAAVARMRDRMAHRGPDGVGAWASHDGSCRLGHRRLSIIDLSERANQPMSNSAGTVVIVFNGEIYNHAELRRELEATGRYTWMTDHSDTEVLLHAFEEWGPDCAHRFYGMFAFAVWDNRDPSGPRVHLVRDRMGVKPLYITRAPGGDWAFASEIKALLAHPRITSEPDLTALWHYLTFIVAPAPLTLFRGIFKVPAGHRIEIAPDGTASAMRWWELRPDADAMLDEGDISFDEATEEVLSRLRTAVSRRMVSDVPFGVLLSGGVDSSLNVALMSELMDRPVTTFTIGYREQDAGNEFEHAARVAERFGTDHHERRIDPMEALKLLPDIVRQQDEPIADNVCIPLWFLSELVKQSGTTVVQVGEGADEHFLGYWWVEHYREKYEQVYAPALGRRAGPLGRLLRSRAASRLPRVGEDAEIRARAERGQELFWGGAACFWGSTRERVTPNTAPFAQSVDCPVEGLVPEGHRQLDSHAVVREYIDELGELREPQILAKIPYLESRLRLPEHLLMRVDKMTMAHSVEARVPFLDHDVVEFAWRLPYSYRLHGGVGKRVIKRAAERFLPEDLVYRTKQGFGAPMDQWFAEREFGTRCLELFERSWLAEEGLVDRDFVSGMLRDQMDGRGGHGFHLWTILNAVLWHAIWIEGRDDLL